MLPQIAARLFNTPLAVDPEKAAAILSGIGGRVVEGGIQIDGGFDPIAHVAFENGRPSAGVIGDRLGRAMESRGRSILDVVEGVAVIGIEGSLVHKGGWVGSNSGQTSYQGLQAQIVRAAADPKVKGVVFEVDSFGGEVAGAFETADMIAELSAFKPTLSILTDHALSAGYLLASAARQIVGPESGRAGSIGVITLHADFSAKLAKEGVKVTILAAGERKAEGNPFEPLPKDVADRIRGDLQAERQRFAEAVGRYRGTRFSAVAALATEADSFRGKDAASIGLIDATGPGNAAFAGFLASVNRGRTARI